MGEKTIFNKQLGRFLNIPGGKTKRGSFVIAQDDKVIGHRTLSIFKFINERVK